MFITVNNVVVSFGTGWHNPRSPARVKAIALAGLLMLLLTALQLQAAQAAFDHRHGAWTTLLHKHVVLISDGNAAQVRYAAFQKDRSALRGYLDSLSAVTRKDFDAWPSARRKAFLINAYNAYTIELILTKYPDLQSIKDLGSLLTSPWKKQFFQLLGQAASLDNIEDMLRQRGAYDDPRIHFALNCASIGCPMLRDEAYIAERIDAQLDSQAERFLSDRSRNRYDPATGRLEVSKIFDWYGDDFRLGHLGVHSVEDFFARYAARLADNPPDRAKIVSHQAAVTFLDYNWNLNDTKR